MKQGASTYLFKTIWILVIGFLLQVSIVLNTFFMKTQRMKIIDYEGSEDENLEDRDGKVGLTHL